MFLRYFLVCFFFLFICNFAEEISPDLFFLHDIAQRLEFDTILGLSGICCQPLSETAVRSDPSFPPPADSTARGRKDHSIQTFSS